MEAVAKCGSCGREVPAAANVCPHCGSARARKPSDPLIGARIGDDLTIKQMIARGGMGEVYLGHQDSLARDVAIKVLKRSFAENHESAERFLQEGRAASRIKHPLAVAIHSVGRLPGDDGRPFMVMEYVPGRSLGAVLRERGHLRVREAVAIARGAADLLHSAHQQDIVHRDIKPDNILIVDDPEKGLIPRVLDFGIARVLSDSAERLTEAGITYGTPDYMSPEQALGGDIDGRTDIYSLALVLYEMLSGAPPFRDASKQTVIQRQINETARNLRDVAKVPVPEELARLVERCLAKERGERPASMRDVVDALQKIEAALPSEVSESGRLGVETTTSGSHRVRNRRTTGGRRAAESGPWRIDEGNARSVRDDDDFSFGDEAPRPVLGLSGSHDAIDISLGTSEFGFEDEQASFLDEGPPDAFLRRTRGSRIGSIILFIAFTALFIAVIATGVIAVLDPTVIPWIRGESASTPPPSGVLAQDEAETEATPRVAELAPSVADEDAETAAAAEREAPAEARAGGRVARNSATEPAPAGAAGAASAGAATNDATQASTQGATPMAPPPSDAPAAAAPAEVAAPAAPAAEAPAQVAGAAPTLDVRAIDAAVSRGRTALQRDQLDGVDTALAEARRLGGAERNNVRELETDLTHLRGMRERVASHLAANQCVRADEIVVEMRSRFGRSVAQKHYGELDACRAGTRGTAATPTPPTPPSGGGAATPARPSGGTTGGGTSSGSSTPPRRVTPPTEL